MRRFLGAPAFALLSAGQNFRRNLAVSLAGVFTMGLILLMVGGTLLATHVVNTLLDQQQAKASKIRVYLSDGVSLASTEHLATQFTRDPRVKAVVYESKDDAAKEQAKVDPNFPNALRALNGNNPLPASLNLEVKQLRDLNTIDNEVRSNPLVDTKQPTDDNRKIIDRLNTAINYIRLIGLVIAALLAFISVVIIMNTIRTAVYVRRTEIEIMKLVGATDWFVRWPFILEGVIGGLLAAIFSSAIVTIAYHLLTSSVHFVYDSGYLVFLLGVILLAGMAIGSFGSYLGVRRFLAV